MSIVSELADTLWSGIISGGPKQAVPVVQAVISGAVKTAKGEAPSVIAAIAADHPEVMQVIEQLAQTGGTFVGGPIGGWAAEEIVDLLAHGHALTPEAEARIMARQGSSEGSS